MLRPLSESAIRPESSNAIAVESQVAMPTSVMPKRISGVQPLTNCGNGSESLTSNDSPGVIVRACRLKKRPNAEKHRNRKKKRALERRGFKKSFVGGDTFEHNRSQKQRHTQARRSNERSAVHVLSKFIFNANVVGTNMSSNDLSPSNPGFIGTPSSKDPDTDAHDPVSISDFKAAGYTYVPSDSR
jgi:hypothetical protein